MFLTNWRRVQNRIQKCFPGDNWETDFLRAIESGIPAHRRPKDMQNMRMFLWNSRFCPSASTWAAIADVLQYSDAESAARDLVRWDPIEPARFRKMGKSISFHCGVKGVLNSIREGLGTELEQKNIAQHEELYT